MTVVMFTAVLVALPGAPLQAQQAPGAIEGTVLDTHGEPVPDAVVRIADTPRSVGVEEDGSFRFRGLRPGSYLVEASSPRSGRRVEEVRVTSGEPVRVTLRLNLLFHLDELVVTTGSERRASETYQAVDAVSGQELAASAVASLGETLAQGPGVTSSYFGPGSSRPVIRGFSGDRVRVLEGGVTTGDASSTSPDHAVSVEPTAAERIEIVRGPATLLYGSSAVGGVVNVLDGRIPRERVSGGRLLEGSVYGLGATVSEEFTGGGEVKIGSGPLVVHVSGMRRDTDDYDIPGFAGAEHDEGEEGADEEEPVEGVLENSFVETARAALGVSYVGENGFVGVSFSGLDSEYGVPGGHGEGHEEEGEAGEEEEAGVSIDMQQRRFDLEGAWSLSGDFVERIETRFGFSDYRHFEVEGTEIGTRFENDQWEGRAVVQHRLSDRISGSLGVQLGNRDFSAVGEEAFVPPTDTDLLAVFLYEELEAGPLRYQLGARYEVQDAVDLGNRRELDHDGVSVSGGVAWLAAEGVNLALSGARSVKLPTPEELFSDGPHLATRSFEIGNPELGTETALSLDASVRVARGPFNGEITGFVTDFDDFIFQSFTGQEEDELPVLLYEQTDARFTGVETRGELEVLHRGNDHLAVTGRLDWVRAERSDIDEPLPRIPPLRVGGGLRYEGDPFQGSFEVVRHTDQDRVGRFEDATEGYTMVNATASYRFFSGAWTHELILRGTNLADEEARNHVSLLKEQAPLPGRSIRLQYRLVF